MIPIYPAAPPLAPGPLFPNNRRGRRDAAKLAQRQRTEKRIAMRIVNERRAAK